MSEPKIILASQSPRRKDLLKKAGFTFEIMPSTAEENIDPSWTPEKCACELAHLKAHDIVQIMRKKKSKLDQNNCIIIGADTVVALENEIFGKPEGPEHARKMLRTLSRNPHRVITGVCLWPLVRKEPFITWEVTHVFMRALTEQELNDYVDSGEGVDKAGGYAIQENADRFVESIDGPFDNVVGLPVAKVKQLLNQWQMEENI